MRIIPLSLLALLILIQYPLWFGKGGLFKVHELGRKIEQQSATNLQLRTRNDKLEGEVRDLREVGGGAQGAVEERARFELGMIRQGEVFVQILGAPNAAATTPTNTASAAPPASPTSPTSTTSISPTPKVTSHPAAPATNAP